MEDLALAFAQSSVQFPPLDFSEFEGQIRWVGPVGSCQETELPPSVFRCASLQCDPYFDDFGSLGLIHVRGDVVLPSSTYSLETLPFTCEGDEENCATVSAARVIRTTRWGDVMAPFQAPFPASLTQPDISDIAAVVDKFRQVVAPIVARTDLQPRDPNAVVNIADVASAADAFTGHAYPYLVSVGCPPD